MFVFGKKQVYKIKIEGMSCAHCSERVEKALNAVRGVKASVNLENAEATIEASSSIGIEKLRRIIEEAGYHTL